MPSWPATRWPFPRSCRPADKGRIGPEAAPQPAGFGARAARTGRARAFDHAGDAQPFRQPWNPRGRLGNVVHRVPVLVSP